MLNDQNDNSINDKIQFKSHTFFEIVMTVDPFIAQDKASTKHSC